MNNNEQMYREKGYTSWEDVAETKWGRYLEEAEERVLMKAHHLAKPPGTAFEVGCSEGRWSVKMAELGWHMICTDINVSALEICQQRIPTAECITVQTTDTAFPVEDNSIDFFICIEVPSVSNLPWFKAEVARVLKPNGIMISQVWNSHSLRGQYYRFTQLFKEKEDFYLHGYRSWRKELEGYGFDFLYEEGLCWFPFNRTSDSNLVPYATAIEKKLKLNRIITASPWVLFIARKNG